MTPPVLDSTVKLPVKLAKEPLIDVTFELRFEANVPAASVIPGLLFGKLKGVESIEALPAMQIPDSVRSSEANLRFAPLNRITWGEFVIIVGDRMVGVGCMMPYPGWARFRDAILEVSQVLMDAGLIKAVTRYSLKYLDFFETGQDHRLALKQFNVAIRIGTHLIEAENLQLRSEIPRAGYLHGVQVVSSAMIQQPNMPSKVGAILEVDTLREITDPDITIFFTELPRSLDMIHAENKQMFFECLSEPGLANLEPRYE